jgi:hypothetical protein
MTHPKEAMPSAADPSLAHIAKNGSRTRMWMQTETSTLTQKERYFPPTNTILVSVFLIDNFWSKFQKATRRRKALGHIPENGTPKTTFAASICLS